MRDLIELRDVDRRFYLERIRDFLPSKIIDVHTHVWLAGCRDTRQDDRRTARWPDLVANENSIEDLMETYRLLLPDTEVTPLIFPAVLSPQDDLERQNAYVRQCLRDHDLPALIWSVPSWSPEELEEKIVTGGFIGLKSYLTHAPLSVPAEEIGIFDIFPPSQLRILDRHGWILMLHIPRSTRLKDPANLAQIIEIDNRYPRIKLIVAHVGRAYCPEDIGNGFDILQHTKNTLWDFSANTNAYVFEKLIHAVGPRRILFGSDLPITRMRMRRICESGRYVNLVPRGLYGDVSDDPHLREVEGTEADTLSFFLYEEINAFHRAAQATRLTQNDIEDVFFHNAERTIESAQSGV